MDIKAHILNIKNLTKEQFEALHYITQKLNTAVYEDSLIEETLDWVISIINAERGLFVKYNRENEEFIVIAARNFNNQSITDISNFSSGILKKVMKGKNLLYFTMFRTNLLFRSMKAYCYQE